MCIRDRHDVARLKFVLLNFLFVFKSLWLYFTLLILQCRILGWSIFVEKYIYYGLFFRNNKKNGWDTGSQPDEYDYVYSTFYFILCFQLLTQTLLNITRLFFSIYLPYLLQLIPIAIELLVTFKVKYMYKLKDKMLLIF